jgi:hypothetical protein
MSRGEPANTLAWQPVLAALLVVGGFGLVAWSFVWPSVSNSTAGWSPEQARDYQAASAKLHSLSHQSVHAAGQENEAQVRAELHKAQAEYDLLRGQLDSALDRPWRMAWWLRLSGLTLVGVGGVSLYFRPPPSTGGTPWVREGRG